MFFHPACKMRRLIRALFMPEITRNEFATNGETGVGRENHVGKLWLRRNQIDFAIQIRKRRVQFGPLFLGEWRLCAARATHPGIDLVLDAVVIRRAKEQLTHKIDNLLAATFSRG